MKKEFIVSFTNAVMVSTFLSLILFSACSKQKNTEGKDEQIRVDTLDVINENDSSINSVQGNIAFNQMATTPNSVILTGLADHRLVTVYKTKIRKSDSEREKDYEYDYSSYSKSYDVVEDEYGNEIPGHFMPGIDILYGYNLLNIAHYDMKTEKLNFLFNSAVLVKTLYYPCFEQDSLDKKPINRDYFMVSVYNEDTNKDTLINNRDLRRIYHFDASCSIKTQLVPDDYSVTRSDYDPKNDVMYIFARHDKNKNGKIDKKEPLHIFWISLKTPAEAKRLY
jgi:hypothetical protein